MTALLGTTASRPNATGRLFAGLLAAALAVAFTQGSWCEAEEAFGAATAATTDVVAGAASDGTTGVLVVAAAAKSPAMGEPITLFPGTSSQDFALLCDGPFSSGMAPGSDQVTQLFMRRNVRVISDQMEIQCDVLAYDKARDEAMKAWPAPDKRVDILYGGVRAECGYLEYYPDTGKAVLRRRPVVHQKDPKGREFETAGNVIIMTRDKEGKAHVLVQSKKGDIQELPTPHLATLTVNDQAQAPASRGMSVDEIRAQSQKTGPREINDAAGLESIPEDIRQDSQARP